MKLKPSDKYLINQLIDRLAPRYVQHFKSLKSDKQRRDVALQVWTEWFGFKGSTHTTYDTVDQVYCWLLKFDEDVKPQPAGYIQHYMKGESA